MKFTWEAKDVVSGRIVTKDSDSLMGMIRSKWTYKIGWLANGNPEKEYVIPKGLNRQERNEFLDDNRADYCLIAMTDGMIQKPHTKKEIAKWLNDNEMVPARQEWIIEMMGYLRELNEHGNCL